MKKRLPRIALVLLSFGLLLVSTTNIISRKYLLSDLATGTLIGIGVGMELFAAYLIIRHKRGLSSK